jgi:FMN phosphatase YigB (HAD superfamily)
VTISFDLDDTIISSSKKFETEPQNTLQRVLGLEKVRVGTIELMNDLKARKHKIYIYTTSLRSPTKIWFTFFLHGIKLNKIINQKAHERRLGQQAGNYSKYPPSFNIDIHVDDSEGVKVEGERHNFKTIIVSDLDTLWCTTILNYLDSVKIRENKQL